MACIVRGANVEVTMRDRCMDVAGTGIGSDTRW
jgi:hypothetical protein